jgi:hypothetical protein
MIAVRVDRSACSLRGQAGASVLEALSVFSLASGRGGVSAIDLGGLDARATAVIYSGHPLFFSLRADCTDFAFCAGC